MWKVDKGSKNGTTTASYATALDWKVEELGQKVDQIGTKLSIGK